ncbi:MAG: serine hydrolase, partial [Raoultibacter sp.]
EKRWYERAFLPMLLLVGCIIVVLVGVGMLACTTAESQQQTNSTPIEKTPEVAAEKPQLKRSPIHIDALPEAEGITLFSAFDGTSDTLASEAAAPIEEAIAAFTEQGYETGFVVVDLSTGKGIGYNADTSFFAASTIKAPYVNYVYQMLIDSGKIAEADYLFKDVVIEGTGIMAWDEEYDYELSEVLANAITHSDNTGYAMLRENYDSPAWDEWVANAGVSIEEVINEWYPYYSTRDLAKFWVAIKAYLDSGSVNANHFKTLLSSTDTSFIRTALASQGTVYSKAGYEVDADGVDMGALNEAGIVSGASGDYLIAVMSDVDYDDEWLTDNELLLINLIKALDKAHATVLAA